MIFICLQICFNCKGSKYPGVEHGIGKCIFTPWGGETEDNRLVTIDMPPLSTVTETLKPEEEDKDVKTEPGQSGTQVDPTPGTSGRPSAPSGMVTDYSTSSSEDDVPADPTGFIPGRPEAATIQLAQQITATSRKSSTSSRNTGESSSSDSPAPQSGSESSGDDFETAEGAGGRKSRKKKDYGHKTTEKYFKQKYTVSTSCYYLLL